MGVDGELLPAGASVSPPSHGQAQSLHGRSRFGHEAAGGDSLVHDLGPSSRRHSVTGEAPLHGSSHSGASAGTGDDSIAEQAAQRSFWGSRDATGATFVGGDIEVTPGEQPASPSPASSLVHSHFVEEAVKLKASLVALQQQLQEAEAHGDKEAVAELMDQVRGNE